MSDRFTYCRHSRVRAEDNHDGMGRFLGRRETCEACGATWEQVPCPTCSKPIYRNELRKLQVEERDE